MKLYTHIERIHNELGELGEAPGSVLKASKISPFDQLHYHGTIAVDHAIQAMQIRPETKVLEIGSGLGGPARHIAENAHANITALELQLDQDTLATELTARCGLNELINHVCGDFLTHPWNGQQFDCIASWLAIFHIPDRQKLLSISCDLLNRDGLFFAEDMYSRSSMEPFEREELESGMYASYLPDWKTYQQDFTDAGFDIISCEEMSDDWTQFTSDRLSDYRHAKARHIRVHGEPTFHAMEEFYDLVNRHFRSGKLGGLRILARKRRL